jgi:PRTRC genetic system protein C
MAVKVEVVEREFVFNGQVLPDPGWTIPVERVREIFMQDHPEITTANVVPEVVDGKMRYTFNRKIGDKG